MLVATCARKRAESSMVASASFSNWAVLSTASSCDWIWVNSSRRTSAAIHSLAWVDTGIETLKLLNTGAATREKEYTL